jgi:hypothetical protein
VEVCEKTPSSSTSGHSSGSTARPFRRSSGSRSPKGATVPSRAWISSGPDPKPSSAPPATPWSSCSSHRPVEGAFSRCRGWARCRAHGCWPFHRPPPDMNSEIRARIRREIRRQAD